MHIPGTIVSVTVSVTTKHGFAAPSLLFQTHIRLMPDAREIDTTDHTLLIHFCLLLSFIYGELRLQSISFMRIALHWLTELLASKSGDIKINANHCRRENGILFSFSAASILWIFRKCVPLCVERWRQCWWRHRDNGSTGAPLVLPACCDVIPSPGRSGTDVKVTVDTFRHSPGENNQLRPANKSLIWSTTHNYTSAKYNWSVE